MGSTELIFSTSSYASDLLLFSLVFPGDPVDDILRCTASVDDVEAVSASACSFVCLAEKRKVQ